MHVCAIKDYKEGFENTHYCKKTNNDSRSKTRAAIVTEITSLSINQDHT